MILEVQHETRLRYSEPVRESITEVRMAPSSDVNQTCCTFNLSVSPGAECYSYQDGFGNRVHHFNLLTTHEEVHIRAAAVVETHPPESRLEGSRATFPLNVEQLPLEVFDYRRMRGPVRHTPRLSPILDVLRPQPGSRVAELVLSTSRYIHEHFEYARAVTLASSPIDDVLEHGKGVCQDFTHLMIAILREFGVPARYVSGYVHRPNKQSQSHAWCEAWVPDVGWVGIDPTNDCVVHERFIKVAVGRDYLDVSPNRGIFRGQAKETIAVRVETRELDQVPSLYWQEQLPPLTLPLTDVLARIQLERLLEEQQQQQQQQ